MTVEPTRNLLLLTIDAWRADFVDSYRGVPLSPTLQSLASHTLRFDQAYTSGPWTSPGIVSLLTGEDALAHGVWYEWSAPRPNRPTLPGLLSQAGYRVPNLCYLNRVGNYQNLGYEPSQAPGYPTGPDDDLLPQALRQLSSTRSSPWFAWHHYKYVHLPYWPAATYRRLFDVNEDRLPARVRDSVCKLFVVPRNEHRLQPEDREVVQRLYAANVRQMDDFLARVLATLDETGQRDNTTIVITADHGDELLEHGHVGHASTAHFATLYEELLRIPLLIIDPRIVGPRRSSARVQLQDLMPTLLSLASVSTQACPAGAIDLSPILHDAQQAGVGPTERACPPALLPTRPLRFHSSRMGYQTLRRLEGQAVLGFSEGNIKYICERYDEERRLLFDLRADPQEQTPQTYGPAVDAAHARLRELYPELDA